MLDLKYEQEKNSQDSELGIAKKLQREDPQCSAHLPVQPRIKPLFIRFVCPYIQLKPHEISLVRKHQTLPTLHKTFSQEQHIVHYLICVNPMKQALLLPFAERTEYFTPMTKATSPMCRRHSTGIQVPKALPDLDTSQLNDVGLIYPLHASDVAFGIA